MQTENRFNALVVHDAFAFKGGGERVAVALCEGLGSDLAFGEHHRDSFDLSGLKGNRIDLDAGSRVPVWRTLKRFHAFGIKTRFLKQYDAVIYSGQNAPLAVFQHRKGKNIYYCHTPPRSLYDLKEYRLLTLSPAKRCAHGAYNFLFQPIYEAALRRMDVMVANSQNVQKRIQHYLSLPSRIVHPPCDTQRFAWQGQGDYYLSTARLDPLKRVDRIVKAFLKMPDKRLVVASTGPQAAQLRSLAAQAKNIVFTGSVNEAEWLNWMGNAIATLYIPKEEDFGLSPVESMAAGKPVIGVAEGGLLETVLPGKTGTFLPADPDPQAIANAVSEMTAERAHSMRAACEERARLFDREVFLQKMRAILEE